MEYKQATTSSTSLFKPRLIIHGGAGNINRKGYSPEKYAQYRTALLSIVPHPTPQSLFFHPPICRYMLTVCPLFSCHPPMTT